MRLVALGFGGSRPPNSTGERDVGGTRMLAIALNQKRNTKYTDLKLYAMVDDEDYKFIDAYHWSVVKKAHTFYAVTAIPGGRLVYMHHLIMTPEPGKEVDHRNRNGLD